MKFWFYTKIPPKKVFLVTFFQKTNYVRGRIKVRIRGRLWGRIRIRSTIRISGRCRIRSWEKIYELWVGLWE